MRKCNSTLEFYCPCGSSSNTELNILSHMRTKHHEANRAFVNIKNGFYPFGDMDKFLMMQRAQYDKELGSLETQHLRIKQIVDMREQLPKQRQQMGKSYPQQPVAMVPMRIDEENEEKAGKRESLKVIDDGAEAGNQETHDKNSTNPGSGQSSPVKQAIEIDNYLTL